jgi:hypothetical protein
MNLRKILRAVGTLAALATIGLALVSLDTPVHKLNPVGVIALGIGAMAALNAAAQHG